tara:strand:+ start:23 stop:457 length:435 start_codon:yes stop_codon:yes gene_type:complete
MSDAKTPKKAEPVSKTNETTKTDVPKTDTPKTEAKSVDNSASKSVSAAQSSTSHFSSVSTPQYRSGWNTIFGDKNDIKKVAPAEVSKNNFPKKLNILDYDIDLTLRDALNAAFSDVAQKRGINLKDADEFVRFEYNLSCEIKRN